MEPKLPLPLLCVVMTDDYMRFESVNSHQISEMCIQDSSNMTDIFYPFKRKVVLLAVSPAKIIHDYTVSSPLKEKMNSNGKTNYSNHKNGQ